jgi:hypothetical protein
VNGKEKVSATTIKVAAQLVTDRVEGSTELKYVLKKDGQTTSNALSIGGKFKVLKKATIEIVFEYQSSQGSNGQVTRNIFFGGKLLLGNDKSSVIWAFSKDNNVTTLSIKIESAITKKATLKSELLVSTTDGQDKKAVSFMLGVSFKV